MTFTDDDVALDGDPADDSEPTSAGASPSDETTIVPAPTAAAPELAWSADNEADEQRQPWAPVWGRAAVLVACCVAVAIAIGVVGFATLRHREDDTLPGGIMEPTTTVTAPPPAPAAAVPPRSAPDPDAAFLQALTDAGLSYSDATASVKGARSVCADFDSGQSYAQVSAIVGKHGPTASVDTFIKAAVRVFCPDHADALPPS